VKTHRSSADTLALNLGPAAVVGKFAKHVTLTTDGACNPNPGRGGWAAILRFGEAYREIVGHEPHTTNNFVELTAIVEGIRALKEPCQVLVRTDSRTAIAWCAPDALRRIAKSPKRSAKLGHVLPLIEEFHTISRRHTVTFEWIRGHAGHVDNERCDYLAERACRGGAPVVDGIRDLLAHATVEHISALARENSP
jgi:ribonuclease HI